jgi:hypothetical protein
VPANPWSRPIPNAWRRERMRWVCAGCRQR